MLKTYKPKEPINVMEKTEELPLIVQQKRFLEQLIEGNLDKARELAGLTEEEQYKISDKYFKRSPDFYEDLDKKEKTFIRSSGFHNYLDFNDLFPAWDLRDSSKELRKRVLYLCLRGLREGFRQFMEIHKLINPSLLASDHVHVFSFEEKNYDYIKKRMKKTGVKIDLVDKCVRKRLMKDHLVKKQFDWKLTPTDLEDNCGDLALGVSRAYSRYINDKIVKELEIRGFI